MTRPGRPRGTRAASKLEPLIVAGNVANAQINVAAGLLALRAGKSIEAELRLRNAQLDLHVVRSALERDK